MHLLLLTSAPSSESVLPALALLAHSVQVAPAELSSVLDAGPVDVVLVDARIHLAAARELCRSLGGVVSAIPVVAVLTEGGLIAVNSTWGIDDILLTGSGPTETNARLRLLIGRAKLTAATANTPKIIVGELVIDTDTYTAHLRGRRLELTYMEYELLKYLIQHAGHVCTRPQLLAQVWGYDFVGGTRTVDVHIQRLRMKLGIEHDSLIETVRNVGYKAIRPTRRPHPTAPDT